MYIMKRHTLYSIKDTEDCLYHPKYRDLKYFTEGSVLMYSGIEIQIEVPVCTCM